MTIFMIAPREKLISSPLPFPNPVDKKNQQFGIYFTLYCSYLPLISSIMKREFIPFTIIIINEELHHISKISKDYVHRLRIFEGELNNNFALGLLEAYHFKKKNECTSEEISNWLECFVMMEKAFNSLCKFVGFVLEPYFVAHSKYILRKKKNLSKYVDPDSFTKYIDLCRKGFNQMQLRFYNLFNEIAGTYGLECLSGSVDVILDRPPLFIRKSLVDLETLLYKQRTQKIFEESSQKQVRYSKSLHKKIFLKALLLWIILPIFPPTSNLRLKIYRFLIAICFHEDLKSYSSILLNRPIIDRILFERNLKQVETNFRELGVLRIYLSNDGKLRTFPIFDLSKKEISIWIDHLFMANLRLQMQKNIKTKNTIQCIGKHIKGICNHECGNCYRNQFINAANYVLS